MSIRSLAAVALSLSMVTCGTRSTDVSTSTLASPSGPATEKATPSANPSATSRTVAFPALPVIVGTTSGDVYFDLQNGQPAGAKVHVCDGPVIDISAWARLAAISCRSGVTTTLYLWDDAAGSKIAKIADTEVQMAAFDGIESLAYVVIGRTEPSAPISMTKLMLRNLRTGATTELDERYGVAFELRHTGRGIAVWRPKNSLSFVRPDAEAGTWIVIDGKLVKWSQHRVIEGTKGWDLLESEPAGGSGGTTYVLWKTTTEQRLTPADIADEKAVAITNDLKAVAWRPQRGPFDGSIVIYDGTRVMRSDPGRFSAFKASTYGDWVVGLEISGPPALTLTAYRISDGTFAAQTLSGVSAFALLGAKK